MVVRPFAATFSRPEQIPDLAAFLASVKEDFKVFYEKEYFSAPQPAAMYIYQVKANGQERTGLIAAVSIQDYLEERVRRHEHTLVAKEVRQAELLHQRGAVVKPVLLAHRHHQALADLLAAHAQIHAPFQELHLADPEETHRFWAITEPQEIEQIQYYFGRYILNTYIADGHHRFSAIARLYQQREEHHEPNPFGYLMCALFPSTSLEIHNFNRVVKNTNPDLSWLALMARISQFADVEPLSVARQPKGQHELTMFIQEEWFLLRWRPETLKKNIDAGLPTLDVSMLNYYLLQKVLGLEDIRNDKRIKYVDGPAGLTALVAACENRPAVAFCLHPLSWEAFFRVIDHGLVLPPKSTWFEPRMRNGVVVQMV
ncbi:DUF1015 family protein [Lewinella cohaerens]|uniref:DUF1015 family protein n=1 Tax=Lewinella cohaerens TaxID=70995 RepID=UPI00035D0DB2|nr:DUF1015 family protein [Lewinella cohaerens]